MNDVMKRPSTWMGIPSYPENKKQHELTKMQANVDGITKSLIKFAKGEQFEYAYESLSKNTFYFKYLCLPNSSGTIIP